MKKYVLSLLLLAALLLAATGCGAAPAPEAPAGSYSGKIVQITDTTLLLASDESDTDLCTVGLAELTLTDEADTAISATDLACGMSVAVTYDGSISESYPAQLSGASALTILQRESDLVGLYRTVIDDLYAVDPGLNHQVSLLAFDLDGLQNLTRAEKSALLYLTGSALGLETMTATYDSLAEDGYLDADGRFTDGLLFTITDTPIKGSRFTFDAQKWRSGLGAYYFLECIAREKDGLWSYTIGNEAIS